MPQRANLPEIFQVAFHRALSGFVETHQYRLQIARVMQQLCGFGLAQKPRAEQMRDLLFHILADMFPAFDIAFIAQFARLRRKCERFIYRGHNGEGACRQLPLACGQSRVE